jgi:transposase InsO family protein
VFPFISITTDYGKEFSNNKITKWTIENKVEHRLSVPYYHQSNGRVERANRTIRNALRKTKGSVRSELKEIVNSYKNIPHRGIGITPNEAFKPENFKFVKLHQEKYTKEFSRKLKEWFL